MTKRRERIRKRMAELEKEDRTWTALTLTITNVGLLWWWTLLQYYTISVVGFPISMQDNSLIYYCNIPGSMWNVPELFFVITIASVAILTPAAIEFTRNARGRFRMLLLLATFATISITFSYNVLKWDAIYHWDSLVNRRFTSQGYFGEDIHKENSIKKIDAINTRYEKERGLR